MTTRMAKGDSEHLAAQEVFGELSLDYLDAAGVSRGRMFASEGLSVHGKIFAFVGRDGRLVLKLPRPQAAALVEGGEATAVQLGRRTMREWVGVPLPCDGESSDRWRELMADAYRYVLALTPEPEP